MKHGFIKKIENFIEEKKLISYGENLVVGVSGGADSVALLLVLDSLKQKLGLKLFVVHVNHGLRKEAVEEASYVKSLCEERQIPFFLYEKDVSSISKELGIGTEEAGRKVRYEAFKEVLSNAGGGKIAVAHNSNDRAETMLFNLVRGTGLTGLISIPYKRGGIIRPLLCVERKEIEAFLNDEGVKFYTDASNLTNDYTRNRIRNNIIPRLCDEVNPEAVAHMAGTAGQLGELGEFLGKFVDKSYSYVVLKSEKGLVEFNKKAFLLQDAYIQKLLVKRAIDELVPGNRDITQTHIESVTGLLTKEGTKSVNLPYDIEAVSAYESLTLSTKRDSCEGRFYMETEVFDNYEGFDYGKFQYTKCFDYDKIDRPLVLRKREQGDTICVNASGGTKKLKDYMIDEKIPQRERDFVPVVACGSDILWVVGYRMSEAYKVSKETKRVIRITVLKED